MSRGNLYTLLAVVMRSGLVRNSSDSQLEDWEQ